MNLASVSIISYADSNDGNFVFVGSLACIKPERVGPECPRLVNFKEVSQKTPFAFSAMPKVAVLNLARIPQFYNRGKFYSPSELTLFRAFCYKWIRVKRCAQTSGVLFR